MLVDPFNTNRITSTIIGSAIRVHRATGPGLLESAYFPCLAYELRDAGLSVSTEHAIPLVYREVRVDVGYRVDMLVDDTVLVELKCVESLAPIHTAQLLTYLKLSKTPVGLLINFNAPVLKNGIKRILNPDFAKATQSPIELRASSSQASCVTSNESTPLPDE